MTATATDPRTPTTPMADEEVKDMSWFEPRTPRQRTTADLDRLVVLERVEQRRRAQQHLRGVRSQLWAARVMR